MFHIHQDAGRPIHIDPGTDRRVGHQLLREREEVSTVSQFLGTNFHDPLYAVHLPGIRQISSGEAT